jgi:hypothetical protein
LNSGGTIVVQAPPANNTALWVIIALLVLIAGGGSFVFLSSSDSSSKTPPPSPSPPSLVKLTLSSDPPGATVFINDKPAGSTPFTYEGQPGDKPKITFKKNAYEDHIAPEIVLDPAMQNQYFTKLQRRRVTLKVTSPLPRSMLFIAGVNLGSLMEYKDQNFEIDWPEQELPVIIRSDTHEDLIINVSPVALEKAIKIDGKFEIDPDFEDAVPKHPKP